MSKEFDKKYEPDRPGEEASENARVWSIYRDRSRETDQDIVKGWNGMLDVLLMFAGLFSAVVTAFLLEVQNKLEPNQGEYLMKTFLAVHRNQSIDGSEFDPNQYAAPSSAIWITALWLLSLMISLIVALFASLSKQWLQEYTSTMRASSASHQSWTFRHAFFSRGLDRWHVDAIVGGLPVALHAALFIFFAGLVLFFWGLNRSMAILVLVFTVLPLLLYAGTTVAPFMFPDCPTRTSLLRQVVMFWDFLLRNTGSRALPVSALATDNRLVHGGLKTKCTEHVLTTVMTRFPALPEVKAAVTAMGTLDFQQYTAGSYADIGPFGGLTFHAPTVHDVVRKLLLDLAQDRVDGDSHHSKDVLKAWHFLVGIARSSNGSQPGLNLRIPSDESQDFGRAMVLSCFDDTCQMDDYPSQFTPRLLRYDPWDELAEVPYTEDALPLLLDADDVLRNSATPTADLILIRAHLLAFEARKAMSSIRTTVVNPILRRLMNSLLAEIPGGDRRCGIAAATYALDHRGIMHVMGHTIELLRNTKGSPLSEKLVRVFFLLLLQFCRAYRDRAETSMLNIGPMMLPEEFEHIFGFMSNSWHYDRLILRDWTWPIWVFDLKHLIWVWEECVPSPSTTEKGMLWITHAILSIALEVEGIFQQTVSQDIIRHASIFSQGDVGAKEICNSGFPDRADWEDLRILERPDIAQPSIWRLACGISDKLMERPQERYTNPARRATALKLSVRLLAAHVEYTSGLGCQAVEELVGVPGPRGDRDSADAHWYAVDLVRHWEYTPALLFCFHVKAMSKKVWDELSAELLQVQEKDWFLLKITPGIGQEQISPYEFVRLVNEKTECPCPGHVRVQRGQNL